MNKFDNIKEVTNFGFEAVKSIEGQYRLLYNGHVVYDDPANADLYDEDLAEVYLVNAANDYYNEVSEYMNAVADLGAGPCAVESFDEAHELYLKIKKFGCRYYGSEDPDFEDTCTRLGLDLAKTNRVGWIGANVCACICLSSDYNF